MFLTMANVRGYFQSNERHLGKDGLFGWWVFIFKYRRIDNEDGDDDANDGAH